MVLCTCMTKTPNIKYHNKSCLYRIDIENQNKIFEHEEKHFPITGEKLIKLKDGEPCSHRGCARHFSHPCEVCGRLAARGETWIKK